MPPTGVHAVFPDAPLRRGMYESFYLRAVAPDEPLGLWIRYTVHKRPGHPPRGSVWCTFFDGPRQRPFMHKHTSGVLSIPAQGWIAVDGSALGPASAEGACGEASWSLRIESAEAELRHLPRPWMYRAPLPRTKLTSPAPAARFDGTFTLAASSDPRGAPRDPSDRRGAPLTPPRTVELDGWRGMVGHNWGAEHAERWIWLHGIGFDEDPAAWLDVAIGRVRVGSLTTPWVANGALCLQGRRQRLGGLGARGLLVAETPRHCRLSIPGADGVVLQAHVDAPPAAIAGWRYADPDGGGHDAANCSIASLRLTVNEPGAASRTLDTDHGAVYELGMREHDHGIPLAPFPDG